MRQAAKPWQLVMAVLALLLTVLVWQKGLEDSFDRPSVTSKLSLNQNEIALLASPSIPKAFKPVLVGDNPQLALKEKLSEVPSGELTDRQQLLLAALSRFDDKKRESLDLSLKDNELIPLQKALQENLSATKSYELNLNTLEKYKKDHLLYQTSCFALGGNSNECIDMKVAHSMAIRLSLSQGIPSIATFIGIGLLIRQLLLIVSNSTNPWPSLEAFPLTLLDMVILVAGGFVVLGEVFLPALVVPISGLFINGFSTPMTQSLNVLIGYISMTFPPLLILYYQLKGLSTSIRPKEGWLQWKPFPLNKAVFGAINGWLMSMPLVLLSGWLMTYFFGDQGGSNPLLELVLNSRSIFPLILLLITTVVLAPLFEELIFRGTLLPVLVNRMGRTYGVLVSALTFALAHLSFSELPPLFVLGLGLAFLRLSSGRLLPCVLMHSLWNGITFTNLLLLGG